MKAFTYILFTIGLSTSTLFAQEAQKTENSNILKKDSIIYLCRVSAHIHTNRPLFVLIANDQKYNITENGFHQLKSEWVKSIRILKPKKETSKYGDLGDFGVIELEFESEAFNEFSTENLEVITTTY